MNEPKPHPADVRETTVDRGQLLSCEITTVEEAKAFIAGLVALDMMFHFEDSPKTIISTVTGGRLFTDEEAVLVRQRLEEVYGFDFGDEDCPIGYSLDLTNPGWRTL